MNVSECALHDALTPVQAGVVEAICDELICHFNSATRLAGMIERLEQIEDARVCIEVFHREWSVCDDTFPYRRKMIALLRKWRTRNGHRHFPMDADARAFFDPLPETVRIYRGCSQRRIRGLSWTTRREVAERFARGHRNIEVPQPVIARALIDKTKGVFTAIADRGEGELIVLPRLLEQVSYCRRGEEDTWISL